MPDTPAIDVTTADRSDESATTALYRSAIGPLNTGYYLPRFTQFEAADRAGVRWNWAASLCTLNWMVYRKLWIAALAYAGAVVAFALLVFGIGRLIFQFSSTAELGLLGVLGVLAFVIPGMFGNALFYADCRRKMGAALVGTTTLAEACTQLQQQASSRPRLIGLALANALLIGAALSVYAMLPLGVALPGGLGDAAPARNQAAGQATDASLEYLGAPLSAASTPATAASAAAPAVAPVASAAMSAASAPAAVASAPVAAPPATAAKPVAPRAKPAAAKTSSAAAPTASAEPRYFINVGLFADDNNALNAYVKLTDAGLPAFKQELKTSKGKRTRVRAGPFDSAPEAERAVEKIHALGLDALIFQK